MEIRRPTLSRLSLALGLLAATAAFSPLPEPLALAHERPSVSQQDPFTLRWVFREADLLSCRTASLELRRARREFGQQVRLEAVATNVDRPLVESFMRKERLFQLNVSYIDENEYRRTYASQASNFIELIRAGRVVEVFTGGVPVPGRRPIVAITPTLRGLIALALAPHQRVSQH